MTDILARNQTGLHFISLSPNTINPDVATNGYGGTRQQYAFAATNNRQTIYDPFGMLSRHAASTRDDLITIQSSGHYRVGFGVNSRRNTRLQETLLVKNRIRRDAGNDTAVPFGSTDRILHLDQPANSGLNSPRMPVFKECIAHFVAGDILTIEEDGASQNSLVALCFTLQQLDRVEVPYA